MKQIKVLFAIAAIALAAVMPAQAQLRAGIKAGVAVNELSFDQSVFDSDNRAGFTGGVMVEFNTPLGLDVDLSAMYVRRNAQWMEANKVVKDNRDYIDIPLNLKWYIGIPVVSNVMKPYLATGPSFSFLTSTKAAEAAWENKKFDTAWNFGFGLQLVNHLQVGASYGIGLTKALKTVGTTGSSNIEGRNKYWTITAAYLF